MYGKLEPLSPVLNRYCELSQLRRTHQQADNFHSDLNSGNLDTYGHMSNSVYGLWCDVSILKYSGAVLDELSIIICKEIEDLE